MTSVIKDLTKGLEEILQIDSPRNIHNLSPSALFVITLFIVISALLANSLILLLVLGGLNLLLGISIGIRSRKYLIRPIVFSVFVLAISLPAAFLTEGTTLFSINIGPFTAVVSLEGVYKVAQFVLRAWVCIGAISTLTSTLGISGILSLLEQIRVPNIVIQTISLTYRYLFISIQESQKVLLAREARRYRGSKFINMKDLRDLGKILGVLFIRTYERSERVYLAMKARGFTIRRTNLPRRYSISINSKDIPFILVILVLIFFAFTKFA